VVDFLDFPFRFVTDFSSEKPSGGGNGLPKIVPAF
jgi:hypothetical protein